MITKGSIFLLVAGVSAVVTGCGASDTAVGPTSPASASPPITTPASTTQAPTGTAQAPAPSPAPHAIPTQAVPPSAAPHAIPTQAVPPAAAPATSPPAANLLPWFQIVGTLATAFAATAAWRSSIASRQSAARTEETARRTAETLGLSRRPYLVVSMPEWTPAQATPGLVIVNGGEHAAIITAARVRRPDNGQVTAATRLPAMLESRSRQRQATVRPRVFAPLETFAPLTPTAHPVASASALLLTYELEFSDAAGLVSWCQTGKLREKIRFESDQVNDEKATHPIYSYSEVEESRSEPTVIYGAGLAPRRPPGLIRRVAAPVTHLIGRAWRWFW